MEHPPAVAIGKGLGRGSLGHNHIVAVEFDVEVRDPLGADYRRHPRARYILIGGVVLLAAARANRLALLSR